MIGVAEARYAGSSGYRSRARSSVQDRARQACVVARGRAVSGVRPADGSRVRDGGSAVSRVWLPSRSRRAGRASALSDGSGPSAPPRRCPAPRACARAPRSAARAHLSGGRALDRFLELCALLLEFPSVRFLVADVALETAGGAIEVERLKCIFLDAEALLIERAEIELRARVALVGRLAIPAAARA